MTNKKRSAPSGPLTGEKLTATLTTVITGSTAVDTTVAVAGLRVTDTVTVNPVADLPAGAGIVSARVSAADTLKVRIGKFTAGDLAEADYDILIDVGRYST